MYKSKIPISKKSKEILAKKLEEFLASHQKIYWKSRKRTISLKKLPEAILKRKQSATWRLQRFFVALDILKNESLFSVREKNGCLEYEIMGLDQNNKKVTIHLREELSIRKDRVIFFVSCY